jgi:putative ATPase
MAGAASCPPLSWRPRRTDELIGPAREIAEKLLAKAGQLKSNGGGPLKLLLYGPPGTGKTTVAEMLALALTGTPWAVEDINGKSVNLDTVKEWMAQLAFGSLYSDWSVKIVNEMDRCSRDAQDLLLTCLDRLPPRRAFIGTSNLDLDLLTDRVQTRFQAVRVNPPESAELAAFLRARWPAPKQAAAMIATGSGGNVRAALADLENYFDAGGAA